MKIIIEIPNDIVKRCKELNISEENIPKVFQAFCYEVLGFNSHWGIDCFLSWSEEEENYFDFIE